MTDVNEEIGIRLLRKREYARGVYVMAGFMFFLATLITCIALISSQDIFGAPLVCGLISLVLYVLARFTERYEEPDFVVLHQDYFIDSERSDPERKVHWDQITSVRWLGELGGLAISTNEFKTPLGFFQMNFDGISAEDRLVFVRFVKRSIQGIEEAGWTNYCMKVAVPLIKRVEQQRFAESQPDLQADQESLIFSPLQKVAKKHPFWVGFLMIIWSFFCVFRLVSRQMCWTVAGMLAVSGLINIRLIWGEWHEPFTSIVYGASGLFFFLGCISARNKSNHQTLGGKFLYRFTLGYLGLLLIGLPLLLNIVSLEGDYLSPLIFGFVFCLLLYLVFVSERRENSESNQQDALSSWEAWENKQRLLFD